MEKLDTSFNNILYVLFTYNKIKNQGSRVKIKHPILSVDHSVDITNTSNKYNILSKTI